MRSVILSGAVAAALTLGLSACTNPYDPGQRAIGGGLIGAGSGALIGGLAAGGPGAAIGAAVGGGVGAVTGCAWRSSSTSTHRPRRRCGPLRDLLLPKIYGVPAKAEAHPSASRKRIGGTP